MRNLLALVGLATVTFFGLGWYLGWYKIERNPNAPGSGNVSLGIDTKRVTQDIKRGAKGVGQIIDSLATKNESSWYDPAPAPAAPAAGAPARTTSLSNAPQGNWYDPTPVPPAAAKPTGWRRITPPSDR